MTFDEVKAAVMNLSPQDQKRLITDIVPNIWPKACLDDSCLLKMRELVDEETVKKYRDEHMDSI
jgi:hypothetical protein